ncbi:MAG: Unknown protein [uncultured Sulfurovum sp.]|uniref:Histidine kinase/HSP90-like ATPase domain-containing protein n=1 Tax=uncultured Sulfurovum sp. TaxID=269237 RepID=A0A6S6T887_9BACT|nr:MAG: Unknown protein [uncultured Sulfurovum sp.]
MKKNLKICIRVDDNVIYEFSGKITKSMMIEAANDIEKLLLKKCLNKDKIKNVFELFVETAQNILNYAYRDNTIDENDEEYRTLCNYSLYCFTSDDTYILESCNLIEEDKKEIIREKLEAIKDLDHKALRKLVRKKSRSAEDRHENGAGLGYIMMARKSCAPIEVEFSPYTKKGILVYKQRLFI